MSLTIHIEWNICIYIYNLYIFIKISYFVVIIVCL